jgi:ABC-type transporter Mla subunit MlaD
VSLGPPFDESGERLRLLLGAAVAVTLLFVIGVALLAADRSLGEAVTVHVLVKRPGVLHTGAMVRVAGEQIGEVVAIRGFHGEPGLPDSQPKAEGGDATPVEIELRLRKQKADKVYANSTFLPVNPTVLAEALIEIGPPPGGAAPGPPVQDGQRVRGVDPADIDQLLRKVYVSVELTLQEARDVGPEWTELNEALSALSGRLAHTAPPELMLRARVQGAAALDGTRQLLATLRSGNVNQLVPVAKELDQTLTPLIGDLRRLGDQAAVLQARASDLGQAFAPGPQADLQRAIAQLRAALATGEQLAADARYLVHYFESGRGTLGGFNQDIQIFDELKETTRILKRESWRVLIKSKRSPPTASPPPQPAR